MTEFQLNDKLGGTLGQLWLDLETTGNDVEKDEIIEIGAVLTDHNFDRFDYRATRDFSIVIEPSEYALGRMMKNPIVRNMHVDNGLLDECLSSPKRVYFIEEAEAALLKYMTLAINSQKTRGDVGKFTFMIAGSGVGHFDRKFIDKYLPGLSGVLHFSPLDVGQVRRFLKVSNVDLSGADNTKSKNHRALDDVLLHLEEARTYRRALEGLTFFVESAEVYSDEENLGRTGAQGTG